MNLGLENKINGLAWQRSWLWKTMADRTHPVRIAADRLLWISGVKHALEKLQLGSVQQRHVLNPDYSWRP